MPRPGLCRVDQNEVAESPAGSGLIKQTEIKMRHSPEAVIRAV
jgi:hypothetical protein